MDFQRAAQTGSENLQRLPASPKWWIETLGAFRYGEAGATQSKSARKRPLQPKRGREKIDWQRCIAIRRITGSPSWSNVDGDRHRKRDPVRRVDLKPDRPRGSRQRLTRCNQIDGIRIVFGRRGERVAGRRRFAFVSMLMGVIVPVQMHVWTNGMTVRLSHTATRVRMRQALPQHKEGNQQ